MPNTFVSKHSLLLNPTGKVLIFCPRRTEFSSKFPIFHSSPSLSHQNKIQKPIVCARNYRRRSRSQKFRMILPKLISTVASNLKMLPEPLGMVVEEFGGGDGGGSGFWKGFGGGKSDGWRRKGNTNLGVLWILAVYGLGLLLYGKELKNDVLCGVLALGFFVTILRKRFKRGLKDWILDLCFVGALMGWRLRREDVQQWAQKFRVKSPLLQLAKGKRRNGRKIL